MPLKKDSEERKGYIGRILAHTPYTPESTLYQKAERDLTALSTDVLLILAQATERGIGGLKTIVRAPRGTARKAVLVEDVQVPDLWYLAMWLEDMDRDRTVKHIFTENAIKASGKQVLECWHLAIDLLENIKADGKL